MDRKKTTSLVILIATVLLIAGAMVIANNTKKDTTTISKPSTTKTSTSTTNTNSETFKQGTYSATGQYQSPGGKEKIKISLTIQADGTVTATDAQSQAVSGDGQEFQQKFISGYKAKVVGKKINNINLDQVSGSSLTPTGFNDAVSKIQDQAKV